MARTTRCPRCRGEKTIRMGAAYPGTGAHRPTVPCPVCLGAGRVPRNPPKVTPPRRPFLVALEIIFHAEGRAHADLLGQEFVREALSSMQYGGSIPMGESATVTRSPARLVEE